MARLTPQVPKSYLRRVGLIISPGFDFQAFSHLQEIFAIAGKITGILPVALSFDGGNIESSTSDTVATYSITADQIDTMIIVGAELGKPVAQMRQLADFAISAAAIVNRVVAIGSGIEVLAASGVLNGKRAVLTPKLTCNFSIRYPEVQFVRCRAFINDKGIWTSASAKSVIPLCLALIGEIWGSRVRDAVISHVSENALSASPTSSSEDDLATDQADGSLKLMTARHHVQFGNKSFEEIARSTGFSNVESMRRGFLKRFGVPPQVLRRVEKLGRKARNRVHASPIGATT